MYYTWIAPGLSPVQFMCNTSPPVIIFYNFYTWLFPRHLPNIFLQIIFEKHCGIIRLILLPIAVAQNIPF